MSAEAEIELADHRVPTGITGGNAFRKNGGKLTLRGSTVTDNSAPLGADLYNASKVSASGNTIGDRDDV